MPKIILGLTIAAEVASLLLSLYHKYQKLPKMKSSFIPTK